MHEIEPYYRWRDYYIAEEDERSPFFGREYSEFEFTHRIYNYCIHPQWDFFGSNTLYTKLIYSDYEAGYCILEMIGEWNDCLHNDIMYFKREVIEPLIREGIHKFILIGEHVLNFHASGEDYYDEWLEELEGGWIIPINFREHVTREFTHGSLDRFLSFIPEASDINWRKFTPQGLFAHLERQLAYRLTA